MTELSLEQSIEQYITLVRRNVAEFQRTPAPCGHPECDTTDKSNAFYATKLSGLVVGDMTDMDVPAATAARVLVSLSSRLVVEQMPDYIRSDELALVLFTTLLSLHDAGQLGEVAA